MIASRRPRDIVDRGVVKIGIVDKTFKTQTNATIPSEFKNSCCIPKMTAKMAILASPDGLRWVRTTHGMEEGDLTDLKHGQQKGHHELLFQI